jgi:hypothetical protein
MPRGVPNTPRNASTNPVIMSNAIDSQDLEIGQYGDRVLSSTGPAEKALAPIVVPEVDKPFDQEKMAMLAFMAEPVTVRIATSTDPNAEQVFEINVNGRNEVFRRGETKTVPRYIVDRLARMKITGYTQRELMNAEGIKDIAYDAHTGLKYDFAVVQDSHPRGPDWLRHTLLEAA